MYTNIRASAAGSRRSLFAVCAIVSHVGCGSHEAAPAQTQGGSSLLATGGKTVGPRGGAGGTLSVTGNGGSGTAVSSATGGEGTGGAAPMTGGIGATSGVVATGGSLGTGGSPATGGAATGGAATGGAATGGAATGGTPATGGMATGGVATGGVPTGGSSNHPLRMLYTIGDSGQNYAKHYVVEVEGTQVRRKLIGPSDPDMSWLVETGLMLSPDGSRVVFAASYPNLNGVSDLYVSDVSHPDPSPPVLLSNAVERTLNFVSGAIQWSPDGKRFLFTEGHDYTDTHLYSVDVSGPAPATPVQVTPLAPMWAFFLGNGFVTFTSPDQVYLTDIRGASPKDPVVANPPTSTMADVYPLCPSPDGRMLAYVGKFDGSVDYELWLVDTASGPPYEPVRAHPVTEDPEYGIDRYCRFSPDGSLLMFHGALRTGNEDELIVTPIKDGARGPLSYFRGVYAPDVKFVQSGKAMLFAAFDTAPGVYYVDLTAPPPFAAAQVLTPPSQVFAMELSADASLAVYGTGGSFDIYQLDGIAIGDGCPESSFPIVRTPDAQSAIVSYTISPDNRFVVFNQRQQVGSTVVGSLYSVAIDVSHPATPLRLNPDGTGFVGQVIAITPDSQWVLYNAQSGTVTRQYLTNITDPSRSIEVSSAFPSQDSVGYFNGFLR